MLTYPKSTMCVLCMLMRWSSNQVTLLRVTFDDDRALPHSCMTFGAAGHPGPTVGPTSSAVAAAAFASGCPVATAAADSTSGWPISTDWVPGVVPWALFFSHYPGSAWLLA